MSTTATNPWVRETETEQTPATSPVPAAPSPVQGAALPQRGGVPAPLGGLPMRATSTGVAVWWVGAHGGAGESTLAALLPGSAPAGHAWPRPPGPAATRVVLTARSSAAGLLAARAAATQWAAGLVPHVHVLGLVVTADAPGRLPKPLRELERLVGGGVPRTWHVPWVEDWRLGQPAELASAPREVHRLVEDLNALIGPGAAGTTN